MAIEIVPSLLGFSMGGMAIMLAFSRSSFFAAITQRGRADSLFMKIIANFFHFIFLQTGAIIAAMISKAYPGGSFLSHAISAAGFFLTVYAVLIALATAGHLLQTARIFNSVVPPSEDDNGSNEAGS